MHFKRARADASKATGDTGVLPTQPTEQARKVKMNFMGIAVKMMLKRI